MADAIHAGILVSSAVAGFALMVFILFGVSLDPVDYFVMVGDQFAKATSAMPGAAQTASTWGIMKFAVYIAGAIGVVFDIILILSRGRSGIITAICGFIGGILLLVNPLLSLLPLAVGTVIALFADNP